MIASIKLLEKVVLVIIAIATIIAIGYVFIEMYAEKKVELADLLFKTPLVVFLFLVSLTFFIYQFRSYNNERHL